MDSRKATDGMLKNARHARFSIRESETRLDSLRKNQVLAHKTLRRDFPWPPSLIVFRQPANGRWIVT
jgi:hypothetical protein